MSLIWSDKAWNEYLYWQETDKRTCSKINSLIKDIMRGYKNGDDPLNGIGDPEYLKGDLTGFMSRKINKYDRVIYALDDGDVLISSCYGHYDDK